MKGWVRHRIVPLTVALVGVGVVACGSGDSPTDAAACLTTNEPVAVTLNGSRDGLREVWMQQPGEPRRLVTGDWVATKPSLSPDGTLLAVTKATGDYESSGPDSTDIWTMRTDGTHRQRLTNASAEKFDDAAWSPAGQDIAVSHVTWNDQTSTATIELLSPAGTGQPRQLSQPPAGVYDTAPAWSPDGQRIAYLRSNPNQADGPLNVRIMDRDGRNDHQVARADYADTIDWNPNGRTLLVSPAGNWTPNAVTIDVETGAVQHIGTAAHARWAGNGRDIHYIATPNLDVGQSKLAQGHLVNNALVLDRYVPGITWSFLYAENGIAVDRCA